MYLKITYINLITKWKKSSNEIEKPLHSNSPASSGQQNISKVGEFNGRRGEWKIRPKSQNLILGRRERASS